MKMPDTLPFYKAGTRHSGVLLLHGLLETPYQMQWIGEALHHQGYTVHAPCLPGHGTQPSDLLHIERQTWLTFVKHTIQGMLETVDDLMIIGYSTGAAIAIQMAMQFENIQKLVLISPFVSLKGLHKFNLFFHYYLKSVYPPAKWLINAPENDLTRYHSIAAQGAMEAYRLTKANQHIQLTTPLFFIHSADDELMHLENTIAFYQQQKSPENQFLLYSNSVLESDIPGLTVKPSQDLSQRILNYSHNSLSISPRDPYLGKDSAYQDFSHHAFLGRHAKKTNHADELYSGALTRDNLRNYPLKRLRYNPQFDDMMKSIMRFCHCEPSSSRTLAP